jgi:glycosyltransferase involved in cell wall biosynthesis
MKNKEKLLIVSAISPFPKTSGGAVRIYNTIKYLSVQFELYFIFFIPQGTSLNSEDLLFLKDKTKFFSYFYQKPQKNYFSFINEFQPYWFSDWVDDELKIFLPKIINQFNIKNVQIDCTQLLRLWQFIPEKVNKIFVAYDISTISFWRRLWEVNNPFKFFTYFFRWVEIMLYEKYFLPKYNFIISMSDNDKKILEKDFKVKNVLVKPNGLEEINFLKKKASKVINLGYIGSFNHPPNRTAITYFLNEIAPQLERNRIKYKYFIAGDNNREDIKTIIDRSELKNNKNIVNLGKVKEVEEFYKKIDVLVAPVFSGSGTRVKITESLSFGIPVISTTIGAEGQKIETTYLKIANSDKEFVEEIKKTKKEIINKILVKDQSSLGKQIEKILWSKIFENYFEDLFK